jgi:hypothetical protein
VRPGGVGFCVNAHLTLLFSAPQTLLVDGYISQTFRSRAAEQYFLELLKSTSFPPHASLSYTGREGYIFFVYSVPTHIAARFPNPPDHWLLDRGIVDRGTVVPQKMWSPHSAVERRRYVERAELQMPVFFEDRDRGLGLSLEATLDGRCHVLRDANDTAPLGQKTTAHIRIVVSMTLVCWLLDRFEFVHH